MTDDDHPDSGSNAQQPGVLSPDELVPENVQQIDETTHVVPVDRSGSDDTDRLDTQPDRPSVRNDQTESAGDPAAFAATTEIRTPDGRSTLTARSDHIDRFFDELVLAVLDTLAPADDPETALAVLLEASSLPVTVDRSDG